MNDVGKNQTYGEAINEMCSEEPGKTEQELIKEKVDKFKKFITWSDPIYARYNELLEKLKAQHRKPSSDVSTKNVGNQLESIVNFIFENSFFYRVYPNRQSGTHEIDQFVVISDYGYQALDENEFSKHLLISLQDYFLCECKNYADKAGATWVGKFNTLLDVSGDCKVGLIFSYQGLTGEENTWYDAHGLTKVIFRLSGLDASGVDTDHKRFILSIDINDLQWLGQKPNNIYDLIKRKKRSLISNVKSAKLCDEPHELIDEISKAFEEMGND